MSKGCSSLAGWAPLPRSLRVEASSHIMGGTRAHGAGAVLIEFPSSDYLLIRFLMQTGKKQYASVILFFLKRTI